MLSTLLLLAAQEVVQTGAAVAVLVDLGLERLQACL
jgi:hypothetical protein